MGAVSWAWSGEKERQAGEKVKGRKGKYVYEEEKRALVTGSQQAEITGPWFIHSFKTYYVQSTVLPKRDTMMY